MHGFTESKGDALVGNWVSQGVFAPLSLGHNIRERDTPLVESVRPHKGDDARLLTLLNLQQRYPKALDYVCEQRRHYTSTYA